MTCQLTSPPFHLSFYRSPANVLEPTVSLISGALALDTGAVCDVGGTDFNTGVDIILCKKEITPYSIISTLVFPGDVS